jgi:hypothetical protein
MRQVEHTGACAWKSGTSAASSQVEQSCGAVAEGSAAMTKRPNAVCHLCFFLSWVTLLGYPDLRFFASSPVVFRLLLICHFSTMSSFSFENWEQLLSAPPTADSMSPPSLSIMPFLGSTTSPSSASSSSTSGEFQPYSVVGASLAGGGILCFSSHQRIVNRLLRDHWNLQVLLEAFVLCSIGILSQGERLKGFLKDQLCM